MRYTSIKNASNQLHEVSKRLLHKIFRSPLGSVLAWFLVKIRHRRRSLLHVTTNTDIEWGGCQQLFAKSIFVQACIKNASKIHKIDYMTPPRGSQDASRTPQDGFWLRFRSPTWSHVGHFFGPRWPREPQDASTGRSWGCLGASWRRLGASWPRLGGVVGPLGGQQPTRDPTRPLGSVLASFLGGFWVIFNGFFVDFH